MTTYHTPDKNFSIRDGVEESSNRQTIDNLKDILFKIDNRLTTNTNNNTNTNNQYYDNQNYKPDHNRTYDYY